MNITLPEALEMIEYYKGCIAEMAGYDLVMVSGFTRSQSVIIRTLQNAGGRGVSKRGLMNAIYRCSADEPEMNIIDVFVCKARKTMRVMFPGERDRIETIWGYGYRWVGPHIPEPAA